MFKAYSYKLLRSPLLYIGILGVIGLCCTEFIYGDITYGSVVYHVQDFLDIGLYRRALAAFGALPFAANFADEWTSGVTNHCIVRKSVKKYVAANLLTCWLASVFTVSLGIALFSGIYSLFIPMNEPYDNPYTFIFGQFLHNGHGEIFLLLRILILSTSCAMYTVMGMLLSSLLPNKYVAMCAPVVVGYVIERISMQLPDCLNLWYVSLSFVSFDSDIIGFIYCAGIFTVISAVCGIIFYFLVRKRVQNEIT